MTENYMKRNDLGYNSFQESHNSRRKREIAEKQIDDSKKFSLFAERKYQTLVSISRALRADGGRGPGLPRAFAL